MTYRPHTMRFARALTLASAAIALSGVQLGAQIKPPRGPCARQMTCVELSNFAAGVLEFRMSQADRGTKIITTNMRFINKSMRPLVLGYVGGSGIVTDDQGNRYTISGGDAVRGMGLITGSTFDPKFVLQPGETSDARFEYTFRLSSANQILGTTYEIDLTVREIEPVAGNQFRLGREHPLHFRGFSNHSVASAAPPPAEAPPTPVAALPAEADPCGAQPHCYGAGPFMVEATQFTSALQGNRHDPVLRINYKIRNLTAQPLTLAYKAGTSIATDNMGNRYAYGRPSTHDVSVTGIGKVEGASADPQFVLGPGESRTATWVVWRPADRSELGTIYSHDMTLTQLEILPSRQVRVVRDYAVTVKDLSNNMSTSLAQPNAADAGRNLLEAVRRKLAKP